MGTPGISLQAIQPFVLNGYAVIRVNQTLERGMDLSPLKAYIEQALAQGYNRIALSLDENSYLYSETLATLVTYYKTIESQGGSLWLVQSNQKVVFIMETLGLTDIIRIVATEDALPRV